MEKFSHLKNLINHSIPNIGNDIFRGLVFWMTTFSIFLVVYFIFKDENTILIEELSLFDPSASILLGILPFVGIGVFYLSMDPTTSDKKPKKILMCYTSIITNRLRSLSVEACSIFLSLFLVSGFHKRFINNAAVCIALAIIFSLCISFREQRNITALSAKEKTSPQK